MLVLTRQRGESLTIDDTIVVTFHSATETHKTYLVNGVPRRIEQGSEFSLNTRDGRTVTIHDLNKYLCNQRGYPARLGIKADRDIDIVRNELLMRQAAQAS